jgi:hypothetical protein
MQKVTPFLWFDGNLEEAVAPPCAARLKSCPDTKHQSGGYRKRAHFGRFGLYRELFSRGL